MYVGMYVPIYIYISIICNFMVWNCNHVYSIHIKYMLYLYIYIYVNSASSQSVPSVLISVTTAQLADLGNISMLEGKGCARACPWEGFRNQIGSGAR